LCATKPSTPIAPTTSVSTSFVTITWTAPLGNGLPITAYSIYLRTANLTYVTDNTVCNGLDPTVISATTCTLPLSILYAAPYSLGKGFSINAKIIATNTYGSSPASPSGNGGVVVFVPDAPINLSDNTAITSSSVIGFTWSPGSSDGGTAIIDYTITYD